MELLDYEVDPPASLRVIAPVYLRQTLVDNGVAPPEVAGNDPQGMVVTVLNAVGQEIKGVTLSIVQRGRKKSLVVNANTLYGTAPEGHKIVIEKDLEKFQFEPGCNFSGWVSAEEMGATFYRSWHGRKTGSDKAWPQDRTDFGYGDFLLRYWNMVVSIIMLLYHNCVAGPMYCLWQIQDWPQ